MDGKYLWKLCFNQTQYCLAERINISSDLKKNIKKFEEFLTIQL